MSRATTNAVPDAASVGELCSMLSLSKRRFYELQRQGVFPGPSAYLLRSRRPIYLADDIRACLDVRRRNVGMNGQIVLFYAARQQVTERFTAARPTPAPTTTRVAQPSSQAPQHADLLDSLAALGVEATAAEVESALRAAFPTGTVGIADGEVVRSLYQRIRARNSGNSHGR